MCVIVFMTTATCPYPEPPQFTPAPLLSLLKYFNIILPTTSCLPSCLFPYGFPTKTQYPFPFYPTHPTFPAYPILRDFIARIIGQYKPRSHTLHNSSYTQQNSDYRYWSNSLWTAGGILSCCLLKKVQLFTYYHHNLKYNLTGTEDLIYLFNLFGHKCIAEMFLEFISTPSFYKNQFNILVLQYRTYQILSW